MTDRTILITYAGVQRIARGTGGRNTTRHMTAFTLRHAHSIMVHRHTGPARVAVTRFTTAQTAMISCSGFVRSMTTRHSTAGHDQTVVNRGTGKGRGACVADRTVLATGNTGMQLIHRGRHGIATTNMASAALRGPYGIMIHPDIRPARITMTILATDKAHVATGPRLVVCMTAGGLTT